MIGAHLTRFRSPVHAGLALIASFAIFTSACAHRSSRVALPPSAHPAAQATTPQKKSSSPADGTEEIGLASWYGDPYHGRRAASGEVFDKEKLTAAHRTLPFQTWVQVTNLVNGRQVDVRITDRGPFVDGRIIDLSEAAAREIDLVRAGIAQVSLHVIEPPRETPLPPARSVLAKPLSAPADILKNYAVQASSFTELARAESLASRLSQSFGVVNVRPEGYPLYWRVIVGSALSLEQAGNLAAQVAKTTGSAVVVQDVAPDPSE